MASTTSGGWRTRSNGFLGAVAAVVLIVVLVGGMGIGYAVEKSRVHTKKPAASATKKKTNGKATSTKPTRVTGTVELTSAKSITVTPKKGAKRKNAVTAKTIVVRAGSGAASDIAANDRVLFLGDKSYTKAKAVLVLPANAKLGSIVSAATSSSMSLKGAKNKTVTITTTGATVSKTTTAKITDVTKGVTVMVEATHTKAGALVATEIIILPSDSPFE